MSNFGQAASAIIGGVIGFFVGGGPTGALYGFELGLLAGTVISPTKLPGTYGPKLSDGKTTTATIGGPVSFGYGFFAASGTVIYLGLPVEHSQTTSTSAKGGPTQSQTTYTYTQTIGIGICEGPIDNVYRIWENGELVYDARPQQVGETDTVYASRITGNAVYAATFVLYKGGETQEPDPTWEADKGVGNVSANRGLSYIMYPDRLLRDDQGQRHPTFKFEVHVGLPSYDDPDYLHVDLETIILAICARCGYDTLTQIDASDMADTTVGGFAVQSVMAGRDALNPLRSVGFFDCVESGPLLKFVKRGGAPLRTLDASELGVYDDPSNSDPDAAVAATEQQEVELPRSIRVTYISTDLDYEDGEQLSPSRFDTDAVNDVDVALAVCISDDQAKQTAEILWNDAWQGKITYTTAVDQSNADIEPSDVLIVPVLGVNFRMRVDKTNDASQILRKLTLLSDDDGTYVSTAVADPTTRPPTAPATLSGSVLLLLDLPPLQDADGVDPGIYAIGYGDGTGNRWSGEVVYKSNDGDTFVQKAALAGSPPFGELLGDVPSGPTDVYDELTVIDVKLKKGQFDSRTDSQLDSGANSIAVGADGRWEIIQFGVATLETDSGGNFFRLSHLLRGRRGTEQYVGTGLLGDAVVGLTMGNLFRIPLQNAEYNVPLTYKAVTSGASYASGVDQVFTSHGKALQPFSPVHAAGAASGSDYVFTWIRRDRLGRELQSGVETAMSEATESYSIDIYNGASVVRTLTSSTPTVTYLAANITTDFGGPAAPYHIKIYQISAVIGRGQPEDATV